MMTVREGVLLRLREALEIFEFELVRVGEGALAQELADLLLGVQGELARYAARERVGTQPETNLGLAPVQLVSSEPGPER